VILDITAVAKERRKFLVSVLLAIFVYVELKCPSLTMTPQGGSALEDTFVRQDNNQKNVLQVIMLQLKARKHVMFAVLAQNAF